MQNLYLGPILPASSVRNIERSELQRKLASGSPPRLVMCRPEAEFRAKHIPGSIHFETAEEMFASLKPDDEIVVYCTNADCLASQVVYRRLIDKAYRQVWRYAGGLVDWEDAGLPLEGTQGTTSPK